MMPLREPKYVLKYTLTLDLRGKFRCKRNPLLVEIAATKALIGLASAAVIVTAVVVSLVQLVASEREARKDGTCPTRDPRR